MYCFKNNRVRAFIRAMLIYLAYLGLVVIMTWPIAGHIGDMLPGSDGDVYVRIWTHRWVRDSLLAGQSPFFTNLIFYPNGVSLATHNIAWINILAWLPLQLIMNEAAAYSVVLLIVLAFNGFATYLLVEEWTQSGVAAFVGGLIVAFWPMTLSHHHHANMVFIAWIPLTMLYLKRTFEQRRLSDAIITGVFIAFVGITRWQLLILGGTLIGVYYLYLSARAKGIPKRVLFLSGLIAVVAAILITPLLWPFLAEQMSNENTEEIFLVEEGFSVDLKKLILPSRYHPLWGGMIFEQVKGWTTGLQEPFIGYVVLLLSAYGIAKRWKETRFWLAAALLLLVLAFGASLQFEGKPLFPMPYVVLRSIPFVRLIRHPQRFAVILSIPVAVLASSGVLAIQQHPRLNKITKRFAIIVVAGLILFEYMVDFPMMPTDVPAWFYQLAEEEGEFAIFDMPAYYRRFVEHYMYYQTVHGKPLVDGKISRPPETAFDYNDSLSIIDLDPRALLPPVEGVNIASDLRWLRNNDVRYLIFHKKFLSSAELEAWKEWLYINPEHEDEELLVYKTTREVGREFAMEPTGIDGLGLVDYSYSPDEIPQSGQLELYMRWATTSELGQDYDLCLDVTSINSRVKQTNCWPLSATWPTNNWPANEFVEESYKLHLSPYLDSGNYSIVARVAPGNQKEETVPGLELGQITYTTETRVFVNGEPIRPVASWGEKIALRDYDVSQTPEDTLEINLQWQTLQRMAESYKIFAHLVKADTGELVSQEDKYPHYGSYPTSWWEKDEVVIDTMSLSLDGLDQGRYLLLVGVYREETMERLPLEQALFNGVQGEKNAAPIFELWR